MKKLMIILGIMLVIASIAVAKCTLIPTAEASVGLCDEFAQENKYIDAGCCYYQMEEWGDCALYFLKGARENEILWDRNQGDYNAGTKAKQYYNPEYYPSTGLGSETGVCLNQYGDSALLNDVKQYYDWAVYYFADQEPPFDMDAKIAGLETTLHPAVPTPTPKPDGATPTPAATTGPTATPKPAGDDYTGVLLIIALLILIVVAFFLVQKKKGKATHHGEKKEHHEEHKEHHEEHKAKPKKKK